MASARPLSRSVPDRQTNTTSIADSVVRMKLVGANPIAKISGLEELPGKSNYFIGKDPTKWRRNIPTFGRVKYQQVVVAVKW